MRKLREPKERVVYKNAAEHEFYLQAKAAGWGVTKRGYPDFICWKNGELIFVEVKPKKNHRLKVSQSRVMAALSAKGIKCYKWYPGAWTPTP